MRYDAIDQALRRLTERAADQRASIHMPRVGCGLAGGAWHRIQPLILTTLIAGGIDTTVYDPPERL